MTNSPVMTRHRPSAKMERHAYPVLRIRVHDRRPVYGLKDSLGVGDFYLRHRMLTAKITDTTKRTTLSFAANIKRMSQSRIALSLLRLRELLGRHARGFHHRHSRIGLTEKLHETDFDSRTFGLGGAPGKKDNHAADDAKPDQQRKNYRALTWDFFFFKL